MAYRYEDIRPHIFTEDGQRMFLKIRDESKRLIAEAGACRSDKLMKAAGTGDSWHMLACIDRLVELGELQELTGDEVAGQHRVFVGG